MQSRADMEALNQLAKRQEAIGQHMKEIHEELKKSTTTRSKRKALVHSLKLDMAKIEENHAVCIEITESNHPYHRNKYYEKLRAKYEEILASANIEIDDRTTATSEIQDSQHEALITCMNRLNDILEEVLSLTEVQTVQVESWLARINSTWTAIDNLQIKLLSNNIVSEKEEIDELFYKKMKAELHLGECLKPRQNQPISQIPQKSIPTYDGGYEKWANFSELFQTIIHQNNTLSNVEKFEYLKGYVRGEAARLIQHIPMTGANYITAWETLERRYNNQRLLVAQLVDRFVDQPSCKPNAPSQLRKLHDVSRESIQILNNLGYDTTTWDPMLGRLIMRKWDEDTTRIFDQFLETPHEVPTLKNILEFMEKKFLSMEQNHPTYTQYHSKSCTICGNYQHDLNRCPIFASKNAQEKNRIVREKGICKNCLSHPSSKQCPSPYRCRTCNGYHHTQLHMDTTSQRQPENPRRHSYRQNEEPRRHTQASNKTNQLPQSTRQQYQNRSNTYTVDVPENEDLLPTALMQATTKNGSKITVRVLIDQCSQSSFVTEESAQLLGLPKETSYNTITGIGGSTEQISKSKIGVQLTPLNSNQFKLNTHLHILRKITGIHPTAPGYAVNLEEYELADPTFGKPGRIDILLGTRYYGDILRQGMRKQNGLLLQETEFGWIVSGNIHLKHRSKKCLVTKVTEAPDISKFWEMEEIPAEVQLTKEDAICEEQVRLTTKRDSNGRYCVQLPLMNRPPALGESRNRAIARFLQQEKKLQKSSEIKQEYHKFMQEYFNLGHMKPVSPNTNTIPEYFIPHHAVLKEDSTSTKLRVVFDASCKTSTAKSLNDEMYAGPQLLNDITVILLRWRLHRVAFIADIEKMYRQIEVIKEDQQYQKILWRFHPSEEIQEYQLCTVTYGMKASPYLAIRTLHQLALDEAGGNPQVAKVITRDTYVDDVLSGANDIDSAKVLQADLIEILKRGGFNLRKWSSNNAKLLEHLPMDMVEQTNYEVMGTEKKSLGIIWNPQFDNFTFKLPTMKYSRITKRVILSNISKIFDPLGWLAPITIKAKLLIQQLWISGIDWDTEVSTQHKKDWQLIMSQLPSIEQLKITRWTYYTNEMEIHGFCDASEKAYGAVVYARTIWKGGAKITLLQSKSKVAPIKNKVTLPRLELCAAQILAKLLAKILNELQCNIKSIYAWSDSTITLAWINGSNKKTDTFVSNRIAEIQRLSKNITWHHVKSQDNPADFVSRGMEPKEILKKTLWWTGPEWLKSEIKYESKTERDPLEETVKMATFLIRPNTDTMIERFSTLNRLKRVLSYCRRFGKNVKGHLSASEIESTMMILIKNVQKQHFDSEYDNLKNKEPVKNASTIKTLSPFLDELGVLRIGGRLEKAPIPFDEKHPIILPTNHHITMLIVQDAHKNTLHGGIEVTVAYIRRKYWIPKIKNKVRKHIHGCITCIRYNAKVATQLMGQLPVERVTPTRAFTHTGVDYAGPVDIRTTKGRGHKSCKGYIALFVCLATKAVHIEVVSDMSTSSFLAAWRRFTARRGRPHKMFSDNGTNFVGAAKFLRREIKDIERSEEVQGALSQQGTTWSFIPALSPHFGGLWEAGIKSTKHHLKRVLGSTTLTFEELSTLLCQIEACLNSRPLCGIDNNPEGIMALTPAHFLIGQAYIEPTNVINTPINGSLHQRWREIQKIKQEFWKKWSSEYLTRLQNRYKWTKESEDLERDQVVIMKVANVNPANWTLARVHETHPGEDGKVRVVTVQNAKGTTYKRAITNLIPLPHGNENKDILKENEETIATTSHITTSSPRVMKKSSSKLPIAAHWIMLLFLGLITSTTASFQLRQVPNGILAEQLGFTYLKQGTLQMQISYNKTDIQKQIQKAEALSLHYSVTCKAAVAYNRTSECTYMEDQLFKDVQNLQHIKEYIEETDAPPKRSRAQRGLMGTMLTAVFGVNDEVYHDIDKLDENQQKLIQKQNHVEGVMLSTLHLVNDTEERLKSHMRGFQNYVNLAIKSVGNSTKDNMIQLHFINMYQQAKMYIKEVKDQYSKLQYIEGNNAAFLDIVAPAQVAIAIGKSNPLPTHLEVKQTLIEKAEVIRNTTHVTLKGYFPIINLTPYELMQLTSTAFNITNTGYKTLETIDGIIAVNYNIQQFFRLSPEELQKCKYLKSNAMMCNPTPIERLEARKSCDIEVVHQNKEPCPHKIINHKLDNLIWKQMLSPNTWMYITNQARTVAIICSGDRTNILLTGTGMIQITNRCFIESKEYRLMPTQDRSTMVKGLSIQPVNLTNLEFTEEAAIRQENVILTTHSFSNILAQEEVYIKNQTTTWHSISHGNQPHVYIWLIPACMITAIAMGSTVWYLRRSRKTQGPGIEFELTDP